MRVSLDFDLKVDVTNPGQYFACCGLLEIAHRLWPGAEGWFEQGRFCIATLCQPKPTLETVIGLLGNGQWSSDDPNADDKTAPLRLNVPEVKGTAAAFSLRIDWWLDGGVGASLKTWAGQQSVAVISRSMLDAATAEVSMSKEWLNAGRVADDPVSGRKGVEPFYFDARRFAHALDAGFSLDVQGISTIAHPAVEFLALVGLQRFRPSQLESRWSFEYWTWECPLSAPVASAMVCGSVWSPSSQRYRFSLRFRDNQKRYKAFGWARPL